MTKILTQYNYFRAALKKGSVAEKLSMSLLFAIFLALISQIKMPLPFTPVPLSMGTFGVCAAALTLGGVWGFVSVLMWVLMGFFGLPVFVGFKSGATVLFGTTSGYIFGYALCALALGFITSKNDDSLKAKAFLFVSQVGIILFCGMIGLYIWSHANGLNYTMTEAFLKGVLPFVVGDVLKAVVLSVAMTQVIKLKR